MYWSLESGERILQLEGWAQEHESWSRRDLSGKQYVYLWADGIYFNVRLDKDAFFETFSAGLRVER